MHTPRLVFQAGARAAASHLRGIRACNERRIPSAQHDGRVGGTMYQEVMRGGNRATQAPSIFKRISNGAVVLLPKDTEVKRRSSASAVYQGNCLDVFFTFKMILPGVRVWHLTYFLPYVNTQINQQNLKIAHSVRVASQRF